MKTIIQRATGSLALVAAVALRGEPARPGEKVEHRSGDHYQYSVRQLSGRNDTVPGASGDSGLPPIEPIHAPFPMPQLQRPSFPERDFNLLDYGASADPTVKNTAAFAAAIDACAAAGGGRVIVPAGTWLTGPIRLKSNVNLHLANGAEIRFSQDVADYLPPVLRRRGIEFYGHSSQIYALECSNIAVTGKGLLNGQGAKFMTWHWTKGSAVEQNGYDFLRKAAGENMPVEKRILDTEESAIRPSIIELVHCRNVLLEGFTLDRPPSWTVNVVYADSFIARDLDVLTYGDGPNADGINPNSSRNVLIEHCRFSTHDDAIAIKSGQDEDGWRVNKPSENIVVRHCRFSGSAGGCGRIAIGSEMSGGVRNVYIHDCQFDRSSGVINIKSKPGRGGVIEDVWIKNLKAKSIRSVPVISITTAFGLGKPWPEVESLTTTPPTFRNIRFENVVCEGSTKSIEIRGLPERPIENVILKNIQISSEQGPEIQHVKGITLDDVQVTAAKRQ
ncbi:MAG: glycosyl hydrolase family 28 protein [Opitutaceae bacterium]|nr:glycosyl hydrolase family 28 protein [Opitutaceae bacterium]